MSRGNNKKLIIFCFLSLLILLVGLFQKVSFSYAQDHEESVNLLQNFLLEEFTENNGTLINTTSIDINLGSSRWNVTNINLNFTNIKQERQIKTIEDHFTSQNDIFFDNKNKKIVGLGVEIYLSKQTTIYGVYIYGWKESGAQDVNVQIRDYDGSGNKPSTSIPHHTQTLNISLIPGWYLQNFNAPVPLSAGKYYLVLYNEEYESSADIYWGLNDEDPKNSSLHISEIEDDWISGTQNSPYLYKLIQKTDKIYNPKEIEMAVKINNKYYNLTNGQENGSGNVSTSENFSHNNNILQIPIRNNDSSTLNFTLNYRLNLNNSFVVDGSVLVKEKPISNRWEVMFYLNRTNGNYSVRFIAPKSWDHFTILKDDDNVTLDPYIRRTGNIITIYNDTIPDLLIPWKIIAESPNKGFNLIGGKSEYIAGEELSFDIESPQNGNYTFLLYALGLPKDRNETIYSGSGTLRYTYFLPSTATNGEWKAYIYWNNETDAGVEAKTFTISGGIPGGEGNGDGGNDGAEIVTGLNPIIIFTLSSIIVIGAVASFSSYQTVKRVKNKREVRLKTLHNKFVDILSLNYLLITNKNSGLSMYEQFFAGKKIDPALMAGFLEAIRNFGIELTGTYKQSQTVKLEYQNSKIIMSEFKNFRLILVLTENPSESFINSITNLCYDVEVKYGDALRQFKGGFTTPFQGISELVEKHLNTSFISPLKIVDLQGIKLNDAEKAIINKARSIMKQNNLDYFFTSFLMPDQKFDPKNTRTIFNLLDKEIFVPIKLEQFKV